MAADDVDAFGILGWSEPSPEPPVPEEQPVPLSAENPAPDIAVTGNENRTSARDLIETTNNIYAPGMQFFSQVDGARARARPRYDRGLQDPGALARLADSYVAPPGLLGDGDRDGPTALDILRRERVLVLVAPENEGGQFSAGLRLGHQLQRECPGMEVREELLDPALGLAADELLARDTPAVLLIDGRAAAEDLPEARRQLVAFSRDLDDHRSYLILVVPWENRREFSEQFPGRVHELGKPSSVAVLARHLTDVDVPGLVAATGRAEDLENLWPPRVKQLADAVGYRMSHGEGSADAFENSLRDLSGESEKALRERIRTWQEEADAEGPALLLATALLEGASVEHVVSAADLLLEHNGLHREPPPPLLQPGPYARWLRRAAEDAYFDPQAARFRSETFGPLVLRHVWLEHPELRAVLKSWLGGIPRRRRDLTAPDLERLADRSLELAATGGPAVAVRLAREWGTTEAAPNRDGYRRSVAVRLLTGAAMDPSLGRDIRARLLRWSHDAGADLQLLTAEVCAGIGLSFPGIALTRLKHLAGSSDDTVRSTVREVLVKLGRELGVTTFLRSVREWFDNAPPERLTLLAESVAELLEEPPAQVEPQTAVSFWRRALDTMPPGCLRTAVQGWLGAARAHQDREECEDMIEYLVRATDADSVRIARVHHASRARQVPPDTEATGQDRPSVLEQLWTRLDEVDPIWGSDHSC
ncbi:hypothetical protein [Saccharomonospora iraqiensis]|uniref:hypothetical protein n=1 Tax=Saccharomonospora iraqiensis TaxID=52698 RepID=UPI00022E03E3|nr:hypothetical protein [Saccharomonospora iraqiensis]